MAATYSAPKPKKWIPCWRTPLLSNQTSAFVNPYGTFSKDDDDENEKEEEVCDDGQGGPKKIRYGKANKSLARTRFACRRALAIGL